MTATSIRTSIDSKQDLQQIIDSMLLAFSADSLFRWVYPLDEQYLACFLSAVRLYINNRLKINYIKDFEGAAF